jgi:hypothetical protein
MKDGTLADRIDTLKERVEQTRETAAMYAGGTVLLVLAELDSIAGHDIKSAALNNVAKVVLALGALGTTHNGVSYGLESIQAGHEVAALITEQAREESA